MPGTSSVTDTSSRDSEMSLTVSACCKRTPASLSFSFFQRNKINGRFSILTLPTTSISRERFIDFIKVVGLLMVTFNTEYLLDFRNSGGELLV